MVVGLIVFLSSANLICQSTDISKCFIESHGIRDNESRLYTENFQIKIFDIFRMSAQNIDCEYSLELPRQGGSNKYPQFMF